MRKRFLFFERINFRILAMLLLFFAVTAAIISLVNRNNIRYLYEESFTERVLLTNALMASIIHSDDVIYFIDLIENQGEGFRQKQVQFYHDRLELWDLLENGENVSEQSDLFIRLTAFHEEMSAHKNDKYWKIVEELKKLKEISRSTYIYVMADTGLVNNYGEHLFTFIVDADDAPVFEKIDSDGLGTCDTSQGTIYEVYQTKRQMDWVSYYQGEYGELYYSYAPILNGDGEVIAVLGTDLDLESMNSSISSSAILFNAIIIIFFVITNLFIFIFLRSQIIKPLSSLTGTARELAEGNVYSPVSAGALKKRGEIGTLATAINDMGGTYKEMIISAEKLFNSAKIGRLDVRSDLVKFKGDIRNVVGQINNTLDSVTLYLNSIPEGIFIMNRDLHTYFRNNQFIGYFGDMTASEFISKVFIPESHNADSPEKKHEYLLRQVSAALAADRNITVWINDYCFSIILKEIALSSDSSLNSILAIAVDITDLMKEKVNAQAAAEAKSNFLSRMSHEMRTPMNAIIGMTKIAEANDDVAKLRYCLSTIGSSSEHLLSIINDVLDMSKIDAGKFELEKIPLDIEKTLMKVCNIVNENMAKKNQKFSVAFGNDMNLHYLADDLRLSQVITNLLSNAVKFTPDGGSITMSVEKAGQSGNMDTLRFSVADTGIGMTGEQVSKLFNAFEQADGSVSRKYGGTGLGLAISKNIVEKMGGRIWAESEPGNGSVFAFEVNLERAPVQDTAAVNGMRSVLDIINETAGRSFEKREEAVTTAKLPDLSGVHILLAEDVEINREIFLTLLEETHIQVDSAENGLYALEKFKADPDKYDLIIMDIQMPEMDGFQATKAIRAMAGDIPKASVIPIIAMTANAFKEDIERCIESGMNDHLAKPIDVKAVIEKIIRYK